MHDPSKCFVEDYDSSLCRACGYPILVHPTLASVGKTIAADTIKRFFHCYTGRMKASPDTSQNGSTLINQDNGDVRVVVPPLIGAPTTTHASNEGNIDSDRWISI